MAELGPNDVDLKDGDVAADERHPPDAAKPAPRISSQGISPRTVVVGPSSLSGIDRFTKSFFLRVQQVARGSWQQLVAVNAGTIESHRDLRELQTLAFALDALCDQLGRDVAQQLDATECCMVRRIAALFEVSRGESWEAAAEIELLPGNSVLPLSDEIRKNMRRANETYHYRNGIPSDDEEEDEHYSEE